MRVFSVWNAVGALDVQAQIVCSFIWGSQELYSWADRNPRVRLLRTETTNDPSVIAANPAMLSINTALQIDLFAQANTSYVDGRIYSGFGGQPDFVVGALHSKGGQAVIALPAWHDKTGTSTVVPLLQVPAGSFQHSAIVTEQGCAHVFGRSQRGQARLLIEQAADPRARRRALGGGWSARPHRPPEQRVGSEPALVSSQIQGQCPVREEFTCACS